MRKLIFLLSLLALSCNFNDPNSTESENNAEQKSTESENNSEQKSTESEVNANEVKIGKQVWMTQNLNADKFRNGDPITEAKTDWLWEWSAEYQQPAWCYYDNDPANGEKYGKLYNWYAVADPRGVCPTGWHVPTDSEWNQLVKYLDPQPDTTISGYQSQIAGGLMKSVGDLQSGTGLWESPNTGATNQSGFSGLPGGFRHGDGTFDLVGDLGNWWSSSEDSTYNAWTRYIFCNGANVVRSVNYKYHGFSVRCLRD